VYRPKFAAPQPNIKIAQARKLCPPPNANNAVADTESNIQARIVRRRPHMSSNRPTTGCPATSPTWKTVTKTAPSPAENPDRMLITGNSPIITASTAEAMNKRIKANGNARIDGR